jgi:hypothetical protein
MSKNFEKKMENKELEKKREVKEIKVEKIEHKEFKEKPEKREIKEWKEIKEKPERKEFKEPIKEKVEVKEVKELEKQVFEKGDKELVETFDPGGEVIQPQLRFAADASAIAKPKETDKAVKEIEKIKPEKENPEKAMQKEIEKIKPEKENFEKAVQKEIEKIKPEKELKIEKHELKDLKVEILEKVHHKDFLPEKLVIENDPKGIVENPGLPGPETDPTRRFTTTGSPEERVKQLEDALTKLSHFIGVDLRPDLSTGALKNEADADTKKAPDKAPDDKYKKK